MQLVVAATSKAAAEYVRSIGAEARVVSRSARQLDMVKAALGRNAQRAGRDIHAWCVDVTTNTVVVLAKDPGLTSVRSFTTAAGDGAVRVVASAEEPRPFYDTRGDADGPGLVNLQASKCVDIKDRNSASGARPQTWECSGNSNQKGGLR